MSDADSTVRLSIPGAVVVVGPLPPPAGGMANQTRQLTELLRSADVDVIVVQTNTPIHPKWLGRLPFIRALFRLLPYVWTVWRAAGKASVIHLMANSGWAWHLFAAPVIWLARFRGVPVVVNYRGGEAASFLARSQALVRFSMKNAARLVVPSTFLKEVFASYGMAATIVPNIVDLARFRPREARGKDAPRLVVARNLEPIYDNSTALKAFQIVLAKWPGSTLTVAGTGPDESHLRELAGELGLVGAVRFVGRLDRDEMAALIRSSDAMLNPSLADNMPNSVLESLASGVPVISTNVGGIPHLVENGVTALLVPPADPKAMAAACLEVLGNNDLWMRLRVAGLVEARRYTWPRVAPVLADIYREAIAKVGLDL